MRKRYIGKAIGRARQTVDMYIADLRAETQQNKDIKIFNPSGQDSKEIGDGSEDDSLPFRENGDTAKFPKCRFVPGFLYESS